MSDDELKEMLKKLGESASSLLKILKLIEELSKFFR